VPFLLPQNKLEKSTYFSPPKYDRQQTSLATLFTTSSPQFTINLHPKIPKYPCKTTIPPQQKITPIEIKSNWMYHPICRRFCSVVSMSRARTGKLTEEMSGPKPTFYLL